MDPTEKELKLTLELLNTRMQLIEARAQIMQYQHADLEAEAARVKAQLDELAKPAEPPAG